MKGAYWRMGGQDQEVPAEVHLGLKVAERSPASLHPFGSISSRDGADGGQPGGTSWGVREPVSPHSPEFLLSSLSYQLKIHCNSQHLCSKYHVSGKDLNAFTQFIHAAISILQVRKLRHREVK